MLGDESAIQNQKVVRFSSIHYGWSTYPPNVPPSEIRPYEGLTNHWFSLIRPY